MTGRTALERLLRPKATKPPPASRPGPDIGGPGEWGTGESREAYLARWRGLPPMPWPETDADDWIGSEDRTGPARGKAGRLNRAMVRHLVARAEQLRDVAEAIESDDDQGLQSDSRIAAVYRRAAASYAATAEVLRSALFDGQRRQLDKAIDEDRADAAELQAMAEAALEPPQPTERPPPTMAESVAAITGVPHDAAEAIIERHGPGLTPARIAQIHRRLTQENR